MTTLLLLSGLAILTLGADLLVRGASAIAARLGLSALVIGLTVVAFGTSAPELAVSINASLDGQGGIAIGNIVGSNIFNVAAILGIAAMICPLTVHANLICRDMPIMLGASVLFAALLWLGQGLGRPTGSVMLGLLIVHTVWSVRIGRREATTDIEIVLPDAAPPLPPTAPLALSIGLTVGGLGMLVTGAKLFVDGAVDIARALGMTEAAIGLTIVAAGTSLPELATSVVAALRRQTDIAIGNVVGSNLFNLLGIGGVTALVQPVDLGGIKALDLGAMLVTSAILLPLMHTGSRLVRWEGAVLFASFVAYLWLIWP